MPDNELKEAKLAVKDWEGKLSALVETKAPPANYEDKKKLYESSLAFYRKRVEDLTKSGTSCQSLSNYSKFAYSSSRYIVHIVS